MTDARTKRIEARRAEEEFLKHSQIKRFPKEIRDHLLRLVNEHGVMYRVQGDGQHVFLYSGNRESRPCKISASANPMALKRRMKEWCAVHLPHVEIS